MGGAMTGQRTFVTIRCGERLCALDREAVREIAAVPELSHPPSLPASVEGLLNLGGEAVVVVNLARLLDLSQDPDIDPVDRHIVVLGDGLVALLVDRAEDVCRVLGDAITRTDDQTSVNDCIIGDVEIDGVTAHVLDASRILLTAERARYADIQRAEQARLDALSG
jgi:purine-binding chemotaxis protein CheW